MNLPLQIGAVVRRPTTLFLKRATVVPQMRVFPSRGLCDGCLSNEKCCLCASNTTGYRCVGMNDACQSCGNNEP